MASTGANKFRRSFFCLPLAAVSFANVFGLAAYGQMVMDGTTPIRRLQKDRPDVPHSMTGGYGSGTVHPALPLEVTIRDLNPAAVAYGGHLTVTVLVRNVGTTPIDIPCSHDFASVFQSASADQLTFNVSAIFDFGKTWLDRLAAVFAGSPSVPGSMCTLLPQATALILGNIPAYGDARFEDVRLRNATPKVRIRVAELYYKGEDRVVNSSEPSVSVNSIPIFWRGVVAP